MTEKELVTGFLSKTLNLDASGVADLYNTDGTELKADALDTILKLDAERVSKIKPDTKKFFDDGYKKAQSEVASKKEKAIAEAIGFETDLKGEEFDTALAEFIASKATSTKDLTDDAVKLHPAFKKREKELLKQVQEANDKVTTEVERITKEVSRKEVLSKIQKKATDEILAKNPILSTDKTKAERQLDLFLRNHLNEYDYSVDESGNVTEITKGGKRVEDAHGNPMSFDALVNKISSDNGMEFKTINDKGSPNATGKPASGTEKKPIVLPKTEEEYKVIISNKELPVLERSEIIKAWNSKTEKV